MRPLSILDLISLGLYVYFVGVPTFLVFILVYFTVKGGKS